MINKVSSQDSLVVLTEGAIIAALAMGLSYIPHSTGISSIQVVYGLIQM